MTTSTSDLSLEPTRNVIHTRIRANETGRLLGNGLLSISALTYAIAAASVIFCVGLAVFKRQERSFADVI